MFLSYFTLFVALSLSVIAAWYSIVGLTAIFAAAVVPIIIMGGALEVAKITATVWLHENWNRARWFMRLYLSVAVIILMIITSMGIFGFLSRAHIEQAAPIGDSQAQIQIIDEKIAIEQEVIQQYRRDLAILNQQIERFSELGAVTRGVNARAAQQEERQVIFDRIEVSQQTITELRQQRAPLAADIRKIETEVGPIKYIAALIYGDNPDKNLLEKAVRWVIILLVIVFDPLAIMLVLAGVESIKWRRESATAAPTETPAYESDDGALTDEQLADIEAAVAELNQTPNSSSILEQHPYLNKDFAHFENLQPMVAPVESTAEPTHTLDVNQDDTPEVAAEKIAKRDWKELNPNDTLHRQERLYRDGKINQLPWQAQMNQLLGLRADNSGTATIDFGTQFPQNPNKGDVFIRVDYLPTKLYKWNSTKWMEIDKTTTDSFVYNDNYIQHLIAKLASGEYDPELLTASEQSQIEQQLNNKENND